MKLLSLMLASYLLGVTEGWIHNLPITVAAINVAVWLPLGMYSRSLARWVGEQP